RTLLGRPKDRRTDWSPMPADSGAKVEEKRGPRGETVRLELAGPVEDLTGRIAELPLVRRLARVAGLLQSARNKSSERLLFVDLQGRGLAVDDDREGQLLSHESTILGSPKKVKQVKHACHDLPGYSQA